MQKILRIISLCVLAIFFSCEDNGFIVQCSDCTIEEPVTAELSADLDPDHYYGCLVQIWEGNLEDSILVNSYQTFEKVFTQEVVLNKKYTVTATYYISGNSYVAVDSSTPRVRYEKSQCNDPCFFVYDKKLELRLKYTQ